MKIVSVTLLFLSVCFTVCAQQTINGTIIHDNIQRKYILYVPASYVPGTPAPLVFNFHGYTSNDLEQMFYGDFRPIADTAGFLVVHPQGTIDQAGNTHWNVGWGTSSIDDVGFTRALIDSLSATYSIDQERIYSTGMSNGGFFSYLLACDLSDRIAAIASVTGSMNVNEPPLCHPEHPMPVMEVHGTSDPTVPYAGNFLFSPIPTVINFWVNFNACTTPPVITAIPDINMSDGCTAEHQVYAIGTNGTEVEHYKIIGGVHAWPGSAFGGVGTNQDINASKEIWRFFSKYNIHGLIQTTSTKEETQSNAVSIFPNPASSEFTVKLKSPGPAHYTLSTMLGQPVMSGIIDNRNSTIHVDQLVHGMYVLFIADQTFRIVVNRQL